MSDDQFIFVAFDVVGPANVDREPVQIFSFISYGTGTEPSQYE